ncbi:hypothetical protein NMY22_g6527 [Coprinellus aureogranulatus]|nr:hypothetical protein NMY22_g6527 [Coprinellus aureogranulatus]
MTPRILSPPSGNSATPEDAAPPAAGTVPAQPMDLDGDREDEDFVSQLLRGEGPRGSLALIQTIRREIQTSVQSVQQAVMDTVKSTVSEALQEFHAGREDRESDDGDDADDESDGGNRSSSSTRLKKSKCENNCHNVMRGWLQEKGLWHGATPLPSLPCTEDVEEFVQGNGAGPDIDNPLFDWTLPYKHVWNDELLGLLAEEWTVLIEEQMDPADIPPKFDNIASVKLTIQTKLRGLKTAFMNRYDYGTGAIEETEQVKNEEHDRKLKSLKNSRHTSRTLGTLHRRQKIIKHFLKIGKDVEFWRGMKEVGDALGRKGMSSDESDEELPKGSSSYSRGRKIVRRVPLQWLSGDVAVRWKYVEERYARLPPALKRGNPPYERHPPVKPPEPLDVTVAQHLSVVKNLPTNWYDPLYWRHLTPQGKKVVSRAKPKELPKIPGSGGGDPVEAAALANAMVELEVLNGSTVLMINVALSPTQLGHPRSNVRKRFVSATEAHRYDPSLKFLRASRRSSMSSMAGVYRHRANTWLRAQSGAYHIEWIHANARRQFNHTSNKAHLPVPGATVSLPHSRIDATEHFINVSPSHFSPRRCTSVPQPVDPTEPHPHRRAYRKLVRPLSAYTQLCQSWRSTRDDMDMEDVCPTPSNECSAFHSAANVAAPERTAGGPPSAPAVEIHSNFRGGAADRDGEGNYVANFPQKYVRLERRYGSERSCLYGALVCSKDPLDAAHAPPLRITGRTGASSSMSSGFDICPGSRGMLWTMGSVYGHRCVSPGSLLPPFVNMSNKLLYAAWRIGDGDGSNARPPKDHPSASFLGYPSLSAPGSCQQAIYDLVFDFLLQSFPFFLPMAAPPSALGYDPPTAAIPPSISLQSEGCGSSPSLNLGRDSNFYTSGSPASDVNSFGPQAQELVKNASAAGYSPGPIYVSPWIFATPAEELEITNFPPADPARLFSSGFPAGLEEYMVFQAPLDTLMRTSGPASASPPAYTPTNEVSLPGALRIVEDAVGDITPLIDVGTEPTEFTSSQALGHTDELEGIGGLVRSDGHRSRNSSASIEPSTMSSDNAPTVPTFLLNLTLPPHPSVETRKQLPVCPDEPQQRIHVSPKLVRVFFSGRVHLKVNHVLRGRTEGHGQERVLKPVDAACEAWALNQLVEFKYDPKCRPKIPIDHIALRHLTTGITEQVCKGVLSGHAVRLLDFMAAAEICVTTHPTVLNELINIVGKLFEARRERFNSFSQEKARMAMFQDFVAVIFHDLILPAAQQAYQQELRRRVHLLGPFLEAIAQGAIVNHEFLGAVDDLTLTNNHLLLMGANGSHLHFVDRCAVGESARSLVDGTSHGTNGEKTFEGDPDGAHAVPQGDKVCKELLYSSIPVSCMFESMIAQFQTSHPEAFQKIVQAILDGDVDAASDIFPDAAALVSTAFYAMASSGSTVTAEDIVYDNEYEEAYAHYVRDARTGVRDFHRNPVLAPQHHLWQRWLCQKVLRIAASPNCGAPGPAGRQGDVKKFDNSCHQPPRASINYSRKRTDVKGFDVPRLWPLGMSFGYSRSASHADNTFSDLYSSDRVISQQMATYISNNGPAYPPAV